MEVLISEVPLHIVPLAMSLAHDLPMPYVPPALRITVFHSLCRGLEM